VASRRRRRRRVFYQAHGKVDDVDGLDDAQVVLGRVLRLFCCFLFLFFGVCVCERGRG
jgi:hypothetical protein